MEQSAANEAGKDLVGTRDRATIQCANRVTVVAIGDSVTSAHIQTGFGHQLRPHPLRHPRAAGQRRPDQLRRQYVDRLNGNVVRYYNVARTGFDTALMRQVAANNTDACDNRGAATPPRSSCCSAPSGRPGISATAYTPSAPPAPTTPTGSRSSRTR